MFHFESFLSDLVFDWVNLTTYIIARFEVLSTVEDSGFMGCNAMSTGKYSRKFRCASIFSVEESRCLTLNPEALWSS